MIIKILNVEKFDSEITDGLLIIYFLFLILLPVVSIISLIILSIYFVFTGKFSVSYSKIKNDGILKLFIGYYLLHIVGLFYSLDLRYCFADVETKLSFFVVPVVFAGLNISSLSFKRIKSIFIASSVVSLIILLSISLYQFSTSLKADVFFYTKLTHTGHSTYLTIYLNLALLFILEGYYNIKRKFTLIQAAILFFFLFAGILLLSSVDASEI